MELTDLALWVAGFALSWFGFDVVKKIWQRRKSEKLIQKMEEAAREASRQKRSASAKAAAERKKQTGNVNVLKMQAKEPEQSA